MENTQTKAICSSIIINVAATHTVRDPGCEHSGDSLNFFSLNSVDQPIIGKMWKKTNKNKPLHKSVWLKHRQTAVLQMDVYDYSDLMLFILLSSSYHQSPQQSSAGLHWGADIKRLQE